MAAVWGRAWKSRVPFTKHGDDTGGSLQPTTGGGGSTTSASGTTCTTTSSTTCPTTSDFHPPTVLPAPVLQENAEELGEEERAKKLEHVKRMVVKFRRDNNSAPERWLAELEVNWVLHVAHVSESERSFVSGQLLYLSHSWILALFEITKSISIYFGGCCSKEDATDDVCSEFIRFVQATLSEMLPFVDAIVAVRIGGWRGGGEPADEKIEALILVRDALSTASAQIMSSFSSSPCCCVDYTDEKRDLLSADLRNKLDEAIWETITKETKTAFMSSSWANYGLVNPRSTNIHKGTLSVINFISVLWANYGSANRILHDAFLRGEFLSENENVSHLTNLTIVMVRSLEESLTRNSESFPDRSLKFLFLINNFHFILQQLRTNCPLSFPMPDFAANIDDFVSSYIQVSWAPVLECLRDPQPRCFTRRSPLPRFESEFQRTYTAQKHRKVPDPEMRKTLRRAIVEEVIPVFTEFLKDNSRCTSRVTPREIRELLNGLFEG